MQETWWHCRRICKRQKENAILGMAWASETSEPTPSDTSFLSASPTQTRPDLPVVPLPKSLRGSFSFTPPMVVCLLSECSMLLWMLLKALAASKHTGSKRRNSCRDCGLSTGACSLNHSVVGTLAPKSRMQLFSTRVVPVFQSCLPKLTVAPREQE